MFLLSCHPLSRAGAVALGDHSPLVEAEYLKPRLGFRKTVCRFESGSSVFSCLSSQLVLLRQSSAVEHLSSMHRAPGFNPEDHSSGALCMLGASYLNTTQSPRTVKHKNWLMCLSEKYTQLATETWAGRVEALCGVALQDKELGDAD